MATESIISATFGAPGSGKTYSRVKWLVDDFLINNLTGHYITNIPLDIPVIAAYVSGVLSKRGNEVTAESIASRLHIIPDEILISWEKLNQLDNRDLNTFTSETFPPSHYLQQFPLDGSHIAIDEFHKYFSKRGPKALKKLWNDWFAEIRKTGCVFEGITQSYGQMSEEFLDKCATRLELINHSDLRDPFLGIRLGDWYELRAGLFKKAVLQRVSAIETMRGSSKSGRLCWKPTGKNDSFVLTADYFQFYNSFRNYTGTSGKRESPSEVYGRKIIFWFLRRNFWNIIPRLFAAIVICWFLLGGGVQYCINSLFKVMTYTTNANMSQVETAGSKKQSQGKQSQGKYSQGKHSLGKESHVNQSPEDLAAARAAELEYRQQFNLYRPAFFWGKLCVLRNSLEISVGYVFSGGVFNGKSVVEVSAEDRLYVLSDGVRVSMFGL